MFDVSKIEISPKARLKSLRLPEHPSQGLAYFCGLMAGDGHIAIREHKADYYLTCEGNPADEKPFYNRVVCPLAKKLFGINVFPQMFQHTYGICIRSKALIKYLTEVLGLPKNRKYDQLRIPPWIKEDKKLVAPYIRGLADADFCLTLKRRYKQIPYYPVISGCSENKDFLDEIAIELESSGFTVTRQYDRRVPDTRSKTGYYIQNTITMYGHTQLVHWMKAIGFSNPKYLSKFKLWRERNSASNRSKVLAAIAESKNVGALETPLV